MTKEELLEQAKTLAESENVSDALRQVKNLRRQWRSLENEEESYYDIKMNEQFYGFIDQINAKRSELNASAEEAKREIIERAKAALEEPNFKKAGNTFKDLMDDWKAAGRSDEATDDALWAEFSELRQQFYDNRSAYLANLDEERAKAKELKEELIERAKEINALENFNEKTTKMTALMDEWKKSGHAGKIDEEELWQRFNTERKAFYASRNEYYENRNKQFAEKAAAKKDILAQAKLNLARSEFTDEEVESMKELRKQWKEVGYCGKNNEEPLWEEFNSTMNTYFDNMKYYKED